MKTQKFYHLTFVFENFKYEIGRSLLEDIMKTRFNVKDKVKGADLAAWFARVYPNIQTIQLYCLNREGEFAAQVRGLDEIQATSKYLITKIK